ncbi:DUF4391 domain-containing protein [Anaerotignum propionicum]|uniref:DUF4391 domain-containing protein n=1 Tax=Anaerotignum propionicum DSM 1682 TaxID=991789 RepID=A0A0X1U932_ANAPI|nr:DUF4391 domain-containing protein [Anaerotignum propionicum]AMJ41442.1 hypothetical protein CPRO_18580 [Anaerotignum propionicum DSM 1682]SHE68483.1 protein of unknown function [[Clostridium] propionicum DSM 1682] [Anaerotignum propionicum DSM 1682]
MFNLPNQYKVGKKIPMKDFIPKDFKPELKKKIKDIVKSVVLADQVMGEDIHSLANEEYNCQVIQFYDFELADIKKAAFVANLYQEIIKSPCVLRLYDSRNEVYSFALKRLNQNDKTQIVVTDKLLTGGYPIAMPSFEKNTLQNELSFDNIKNKTNKVAFYLEIYVRAYILMNDKLYANIKSFLSKPIWYNERTVIEVYKLLYQIAVNKENVQKSISNREKMQLNQEIRQFISELDKI